MKAQMPPFFLALGHRVQRQRGLAGGFRAVNFHHPAARQAADAERDVQPERARRDGLDVHRAVVLAQFHHRALAELPLDLGERGGQGLGFVHGGSFDDTQGGNGHGWCSLWRGFARGTNGWLADSWPDGTMYPICSPFAICSQNNWVLAPFDPLRTEVVPFDFRSGPF